MLYPAMIERGGGAIVITGSVQSVAAQRNSVHYVVSKHGLLGLTRCLALDYGTQHIRANCVLPGAIDTPLLRGAERSTLTRAGCLRSATVSISGVRWAARRRWRASLCFWRATSHPS